MTAPITGFTACALLDPLNYWYIELSGTQQGVEVAQVLEYGVQLGLISNGTSKINANGWQVSTTDKNGVTAFCTTGDFIVIGANQEGQLASIALYAGPDSTYAETPPFSAFMTANLPLAWAATTTAPTAAATAVGEATLTFPAPVSGNGPFTYTVAQTTGGTTTTATLSGSPAASDQNVTLTITALTTGADYTFAATTATQYQGVTATSLASNQITSL